MTNYAGRVALITGGASGIGRATAVRLIELGASVAIADVAADGQAVAEEIHAEFVNLDVGDSAGWDDAVQHVIDVFGHVDLLHLNAGIQSVPTATPIGDDPFVWATEEGLRRVTRVNIDGVVLGVLRARTALQEHDASDIVITGSLAAVEPMLADPFYSMSKHATVGFARSIAPTLSPLGIKVQVVCPGGVDTAIVPPDMRIPGRPFAPPRYVADAVVNAIEVGEPGDVWIANCEGVAPWKYTYSAVRQEA